MSKTKIYGIFELVNRDTLTKSSVEKSLENLLAHIDECRKGHKDGVWSWEEIVTSISNYVLIMKKELERSK